MTDENAEYVVSRREQLRDEAEITVDLDELKQLVQDSGQIFQADGERPCSNS